MNFIEFITNSDYGRLDVIERWQGLNTIMKETISSHQNVVSIFTTLMVEEIGFSLENQLLAIQYANFHDFDEIITGDLTHAFKHNDFNGDKLRAITSEYVKEKFKKDYCSESDKPIPKLLKKLVVDGIDNNDVKNIVKIADWLAMCMFLKRELDMGNKSVIHHHVYCRRAMVNKINSFLDENKNNGNYNLQILIEIRNQNHGKN